MDGRFGERKSDGRCLGLCAVVHQTPRQDDARGGRRKEGKRCGVLHDAEKNRGKPERKKEEENNPKIDEEQVLLLVWDAAFIPHTAYI